MVGCLSAATGIFKLNSTYSKRIVLLKIDYIFNLSTSLQFLFSIQPYLRKVFLLKWNKNTSEGTMWKYIL